jgi:hypothetical protein
MRISTYTRGIINSSLVSLNPWLASSAAVIVWPHDSFLISHFVRVEDTVPVLAAVQILRFEPHQIYETILQALEAA